MGAYVALTGFTWRWYKGYLLLGIVLLPIGFSFKVMHWPFATILMLGGVLALLGAYAIGISKKPRWTLLDYVKIGWALLLAGRFSVAALSAPWQLELTYAAIFATLVLTMAYMIVPVNTNRAERPSQPKDVLDWDQTQSGKQA